MRKGFCGQVGLKNGGYLKGDFSELRIYGQALCVIQEIRGCTTAKLFDYRNNSFSRKPLNTSQCI